MKAVPSKKNNWKVYESFISCWWYFEYNMVGLKISHFDERTTKDPNYFYYKLFVMDPDFLHKL